MRKEIPKPKNFQNWKTISFWKLHSLLNILKWLLNPEMLIQSTKEVIYVQRNLGEPTHYCSSFQWKVRIHQITRDFKMFETKHKIFYYCRGKGSWIFKKISKLLEIQKYWNNKTCFTLLRLAFSKFLWPHNLFLFFFSPKHYYLTEQ